MSSFFFFNDTATTEIYTLSLHDALPISARQIATSPAAACADSAARAQRSRSSEVTTGSGYEENGDMRNSLHFVDRKSTRLNSSHSQISYAVFCLKKKTTRR